MKIHWLLLKNINFLEKEDLQCRRICQCLVTVINNGENNMNNKWKDYKTKKDRLHKSLKKNKYKLSNFDKKLNNNKKIKEKYNFSNQ